MKKATILFLCIALTLGVLSACKKEEPSASESPSAAQSGTPAEETAKTGLAVITSVAKSTPAGTEEGLAQADSLAVAVLVSGDGKILACSIDSVQSQISFTSDGKLKTDKATTFKTKQELGEEYGMKKASEIGKEWNEQADAFAKYVVGKTSSEVKGIAVDDEGYATEPDLTSSVTVHVTDFISAVEKAVTNAKELGAKPTDKLGLGITTEMSKSKDATAEEAGLAEAYSFYTAATTGSDGKITSCYIDASLSDVDFDTKGAITSDINEAPKTKQELGDEYGMKKASKIGKEWFEEADAFAAYVKGKTAEEVKGIAVSSDGYAADADLISSVTVHVGPLIAVVEKAAANAK
ncbi:MAG: hypothetical protein VB064_10955 [Oscillospiraceae bacterium]|nr:hypothetical protein [Oscillospiraceae bacterium]